jgi:hypothetical protein
VKARLHGFKGRDGMVGYITEMEPLPPLGADRETKDTRARLR